MMKNKTISYEIKELKKNIFSVVIKDNYHRAMLFCRCQEYYESPNPNFRNTKFSIWDYIEWYSREHNNKFTYTGDWGGFNLPFEIMEDCMDKCERETPYDYKMLDIIDEINLQKTGNRAYVIGVDTTDSDTYIHEICHGLYYLNKEYKTIADEITNSLDKEEYLLFKTILLNMGYTESVINDEIQAYMMTCHIHFSRKYDKDKVEKLHKVYYESLSSFLDEDTEIQKKM